MVSYVLLLMSSLPLLQQALAGGFTGQCCGDKAILVSTVQPAPSHSRPNMALVWCHPEGKGWAYLLILILLTVKAMLHGVPPRVVHVERKGEGPCLCLLQLPKAKACHV